MTRSFLRVNDLSELPDPQPTYVAIGSFDGVHLGHQRLLHEMVAAARSVKMRTAVLTFFPHPKRVIRELTGRYYITTLTERTRLLADLGLDLVVTHPFNQAVRQTRAADFVDLMCRHLGLRQLWGGNFALGYGREGNVPYLRRLGLEKGFSVALVEAMVEWNGQVVSSSRVRTGLSSGDLDDVNGCLARTFILEGEVVEGQRRGRTIGFPTANLSIWSEQLLPADGVYATYAWIGGQRHVAATNIGFRPTVDGRNRVVETHVLDYDADLYGQRLRLALVTRIRSEMKFANLDALKAQIQNDVDRIRRLLAANG